MLKQAQTRKNQDIEAKDSEISEAQLLLDMQASELNRRSAVVSMKNEDERSACLKLQERMEIEISKLRELQQLRSQSTSLQE